MPIYPGSYSPRVSHLVPRTITEGDIKPRTVGTHPTGTPSFNPGVESIKNGDVLKQRAKKRDKK